MVSFVNSTRACNVASKAFVSQAQTLNIFLGLL